MDQIAFLFSGQGTQYTGMGKSLAECSAAAAEVFRLADEVRPGTSEQCFSAPKEELSLTVNTQPCVYSVDLAAAEALCEKGIRPAAVAGFSLGEVAALTFSGVFSARDGFSFVCRRGAFMNEAAEQEGGGMAAVLKLKDETVGELCGRYGRVYPVNYNCPGQLAVAGEKEELQKFCADVTAAGGRTVMLPVSGAFHSPFMDSAAEKLRTALAEIPVQSASVPVFSDCTAQPYGTDPAEIRANIVRQVNHPVLWRKILERMDAAGVRAFVEVGPGKVLSGLVKKTLPGARIYHVEDADSLNETLSALKEQGERA